MPKSTSLYYFLLLCSVYLTPSLGFAQTIDDCESGKGNVVVIEGKSYYANAACDATISITTNPGVHVEGGKVTYTAPGINLSGPFSIKQGASFSAKGQSSTAHIQFIGDQSIVFDQIGQQAVFRAELVDLAGDKIPNIELVWSLASTANIQLLASDGASATVKSLSNTVGNTVLTVAYPLIGVATDAQILIADLAPNAVYVSSQHAVDKVVTVDYETVTLQRNATTEAIQIGDIVVSGDAAGILIRVTSISMTDTQVILTGVSASVVDAFANYSFRGSSRYQSITLEQNLDTGVQTVYGTDGEVSRSLLDGIKCTDESNNNVGLSIKGGTITITPSYAVTGDLVIVNHVVEEFSLELDTKLSVLATTGSLNFATELSKMATCKLELTTISTPSIPVYGLLSATLGITPIVGIDASGTFVGPSFSIEGPKAQLDGSAKGGICYTRTDNRWMACAKTAFVEKIHPISPVFTKDNSFYMKLAPFGILDFGLTLDIGRSDLSINLVSLRFMELKAAMQMDLKFTSPYNYLDPFYVGPEWELYRIFTGDFKADLGGDVLDKLREQIGIETQPQWIGDSVFKPVRRLVSRSPTVGMSMKCLPKCPIASISGGGSMELQVAALDWNTAEVYMDLSGTAQIYTTKNATDELLPMFSAPMTAGKAVVNWVPQQSEEGNHTFFPRLETDLLSKVFPYGSNTGRDVCVGDQCIKYIKLDNNGRELPYDAPEWVCVKEKATGLIWEVKVRNWYAFRSYGKEYTLDEAKEFAKAVNGTKLCGFSDWRLPSIEELRSLVYCGGSDPEPPANWEWGCPYTSKAPTINTYFFPNMLPMFWYYQSGSTKTSSSGDLFKHFVNFGNGTSYYVTTHVDKEHVRLIRGE